VVGAEHHVYMRRPTLDEVTILLCQAAGDGDLHLGAVALEGLDLTEMAVELVVGVIADAARVQDDDVGLLHIVGGLHALAIEQTSDPLRVVRVHLAAERADDVALGHWRQVRGWPPRSQRLVAKEENRPRLRSASAAAG